MDSGKTWLTYKQAAKRVNSSLMTMQNWRRQGMPMEWRMIEGQRTRVVELKVLLSWWRRKLQSSPVHFYRLRKAMAEDGIVLEMPEHVKAMRQKAADTRRGIRAPEPAERPSLGPVEPESGIPEPVVDPLADMEPLKGGGEYRVLTERLRVATPRCAGIPEFTADRVSAEDTERMAGICAACPLLDQCDTFATVSRPAAGFWAGAARH